MRLTPPKKWVFWVSALLAVLGLVGTFVTLPFVSGFAFWFAFVGWLVLALGNTLKGF